MERSESLGSHGTEGFDGDQAKENQMPRPWMSGLVVAVATPTRRYSLGGDDIKTLEEFTKPGHGAHVPWIRAVYFDGSTKEFNVALLEYVERAPGEQEKAPALGGPGGPQCSRCEPKEGGGWRCSQATCPSNQGFV